MQERKKTKKPHLNYFLNEAKTDYFFQFNLKETSSLNTR